jgi:Outer membrane protein beta-barrel family/CarboxypepD_reg-like domain/TonB-dependent Receptor Plug Domain
MLRSLPVLVLFNLIAFISLAQNGTIAGKVTDLKSKESIIGANVVIQGTTVGASTDLDGSFTIANVKPGTYSLVVSFISYKTQIIPGVVVEPGKRTSLEIPIAEDIAELQEVVVTAIKEIATDVSLVSAIKESKLVVSGISSEQITKLPDRDAAQVAQRVPGITIQDGRFILIRGVPERYNQVMINGIIGPSTEIDKRSFSFDLIPSGAIDQMLIYKSASAELPGDFAGGVIKLITKNPSYENFVSVGLNFGYRVNTTGQDFLKSEGSSTDKFAFDNGFRDLPASFPSTAELKNSNRAAIIRETAGKSLTNNFTPEQRKAAPDMGFNVAFSQNFNAGAVRFNNLTSLAYSNSYQIYQSDFLRYNSFSSTGETKRFQYLDKAYSNDVRINAMHNWLIELNRKNKIEFKNLFVQLGEDKTTLRTGNDFIQRPTDDFKNYAYHYLSRTIYTGQLEGTHKFGDESAQLNWVLGMNYISRNEPDYRRFRTFRNQDGQITNAPFSMLLPPSGNLFETGRFWSELKDQGYSHGLNFEKKFGNATEKRVMTVKAGYFFERKTRTFDARYMNYLYPGFFNQEIGQQLINEPLDRIFNPDNIKSLDGFVIEEGTTNVDRYDGQNTLGAAYVSGLLPINKFDVSVGFRGEYNVQKVSALGNDGRPITVDNPVFAPLPLFNVAYNFGERSLMRVAYSRTINRPEFRELAPFLYYQFETESALIGNPNLKTAFIHNVDLRWEMYPNPGELISLGAFYKSITDPIEFYLQITSDVPQLYYSNSKSAYNYGVELEMRKSLASFGVSRILRNMSFNLNAAVIKSQVDIGTAGGNLAQYRPLQGQSPYIVNFGLYYNDERAGYSVNAAYNVFGPRILSVGDVNFPTWWEMPRQSLDFQASKKLGKAFSFTLNASNVLNSAFRILQDNNFDQKINSDEALIQKYKVGTQFSLGLNWKVGKS